MTASSPTPPGTPDVAGVLASHEWRPELLAEGGMSTAHNSHTYDAWCAICRGDVAAIAAALAPYLAQRDAQQRAEALREAEHILTAVRRLPPNWLSIRDGVLSPGLRRAAEGLRIALRARADRIALLHDGEARS